MIAFRTVEPSRPVARNTNTPCRSSDPFEPEGPWILIAATSRETALSFAWARGIHPSLVLTRADLIAKPSVLRTRIRQSHGVGAIVHSSDWERQQNPQLYEFALAVAPVQERLIVDDANGVVHRLDRLATAARLPAQLAHAAVAIGAQSVKISRSLSTLAQQPASDQSTGSPAVLSIWNGGALSFGGSVSHVSGILGGFQRVGCKVGLLSTGPPPSDVEAVIDDLEITAPVPAALRVTGDTH